ncbi:uncharacterized protein LOC112548049 [Alligator sinensis]|uniref:Uncharacterized protein LOC112548049 n=1 Tax=Alligator sinensis TaxID=38654 RepID=A0A3Q0FKY4_ALLSI|nr:uncharacterized protein LOC112548049 [Alligator sinensis]
MEGRNNLPPPPAQLIHQGGVEESNHTPDGDRGQNPGQRGGAFQSLDQAVEKPDNPLEPVLLLQERLVEDQELFSQVHQNRTKMQGYYRKTVEDDREEMVENIWKRKDGDRLFRGENTTVKTGTDSSETGATTMTMTTTMRMRDQEAAVFGRRKKRFFWPSYKAFNGSAHKEGEAFRLSKAQSHNSQSILDLSQSVLKEDSWNWHSLLPNRGQAGSPTENVPFPATIKFDNH